MVCVHRASDIGQRQATRDIGDVHWLWTAASVMACGHHLVYIECGSGASFVSCAHHSTIARLDLPHHHWLAQNSQLLLYIGFPSWSGHIHSSANIDRGLPASVVACAHLSSIVECGLRASPLAYKQLSNDMRCCLIPISFVLHNGQSTLGVALP